MSPIHLKYLGNMGVRSSLSISVVINENLWGLIACHGYGETGIRVTLPVRELCRNIGECAAMNIQRLLLWERIQRRKVPKVSSSHQNPASFIAASSADLLQAFGADCGLLSISDESRTIGKLDPYREVLAILAHLQQIRFTSIYSSQNINADFPNINYPPGINTIAGILVIPLSLNGTDFLIFFRKGQLQEICWAGNPYEKVVKPGSEYLEPRMSFKHWTEKVVGMSTEWTEDQVETASVISLLYGRFIEIWRQKESAGQRNKLTRLLIKNSSHEVRTPLNAIVNYLEIALENHIDDNTREILSKAHEASRSLIYVIDDLLNLTKAEDTPFSTPGEAFDLGATVSEVITTFRKEAMRKGLDLTVSTHEGIPETVKGDSSRLRQVLSNITSNAFQHSISGTIKFDTRLVRTKDNVTIIGITIQDAGIGMSESQLDDLFQEFEQVSTEDNRLIVDDTTPSTVDNDIGGTLGVGLAVVARYVRNMKGLIRVQSEPGKGTIFGIELPFEIVTTSPGTRVLQTSTGEESISRAELRISCESITEPQTVGLYSSAGSPIMLPSSIQDESLKDTVLIDNPLLTDDPATGESLKSAHPFSTMDIAGADSVRSPLSVLVAEDNPINWRLVQKRLQKWGHLVVLKADGQECHDHYKQISRSVDVVLMDIQVRCGSAISIIKN
jgi:light-regulated signal transduction histidine kinase (bacteriophytochrome)/CheY-like chemotaxis protein